MGLDGLIPGHVLADLTRLADLVAPSPVGLDVGRRRLRADCPIEDVADAVYECWYLAPPVGPPQSAPGANAMAGRRSLAPLLRASVAAATRFETGWVVLAALDRGVCVAGKDTHQRQVRPGDYVGLGRPGAPVAPGEQLAVTARVDTVEDDTRWWATRSPAGEPSGDLGRFYLHPRADTVPSVLHRLTRRLDEAPFAWSVKCPIDPAGYRRPDSLVLFVPRPAVAQTRDLVCEVAAEAEALLVAHCPPLTLWVADGVAYADDPGPGSSFGISRCRALAPGVVAVARQALSGDEAVDTLLQALISTGIDPRAPWLSPVPP